MKKMILVILVLLSSVSFASAKKVRFPAIIAAKDSNSMIIFKKCYFIDDCHTVGSEEGYYFQSLNFSSGKDKAKAIGIGVVEGGVGAVLGFIPSWGILVKYSSWAGYYGSLGASFAAGIAIPSLITDALNPAFYWRKAKIKSRFFDRNNYIYDDFVTMEFASDKKMDKHVKALENILRKNFEEK